MRLYFASSSARWAEVRRHIKMAETEGHVITHDWTPMVEALGDKRDQDTDPSVLKSGAHADRMGVYDCDILINLWDSTQAGAMIETGMAIGLGKEVWICAELPSSIRWNIFWELPQVRLLSITQLVFRLKNIDVWSGAR